MSDRSPVALLGWDEQPIRVVQDAHWVLEDRADSTNQIRVTTTLAEADGVESDQELIFKGRRFCVAQVDRDRRMDRAIIIADEVQAELASLVIEDYSVNSWTLDAAVDRALRDTRWSAGELQGVRHGRAHFEDISVLDALHFLARHQDAQLRFDSLRRRVNITENAGTRHEVVFTYGRHLTGIEKVEKAPTTTVIIPTGADDMTIESVNDGSRFVEDYGYYLSKGLTLAQARARYRKEDYWSDNRYEVAENLLRDAQKRLAEEAYPQISYKLTTVATVPVEGEDDFDLTNVHLGDQVYVWDQEVDAKLRAEVTMVTTSSDASVSELGLSYLPDSLGASVPGRYFGDSGSATDGPDRWSSQPQPRPSMPILESVSDLGVGIVRWNGQDEHGNYDTIPRRFGTVEVRVAPYAEDGSVASPDGETAYSGTSITNRGGGVSTVAFPAPGLFTVWFQMVGQDARTKSLYSEPLIVEVDGLVDADQIQADLDQAQQRIDDARARADQQFAALGVRADEVEQAIDQAQSQIDAAQGLLDQLPAPDDLNTAVQQAQDAINTLGDVSQRLQDAEAALNESATRSELDALDQQLTDAFSMELQSVLDALQGAGRTWSQATPPPAGVTHEWSATPHQSESVKRFDGDEISRNRFINPSFEESTSGVTTSGPVQLALQTWATGVLRGGRSLNAVVTSDATGLTLLSQSVSVISGGYLSVTVPVRWSAGSRYARLYFTFGRSDGTVVSSVYPAPPTMLQNNFSEPLKATLQVPATATFALVRLQLLGADSTTTHPVAGTSIHTDGWQAVSAPTEQEASEGIAEYFDGDSLDDRQNDLWITPSGQQHRWDVNTKSWVAFSNEQIQQAVDEALSKSDAALTMAGSKNSWLYGTTPPSFDGVVAGDYYSQRDAQRNIIGTWRWNGSTWQSEVLSDSVLGNVSVGKLVAGSANIHTAVLSKIWAELGVFDRLEAQSGWVGGAMLEDGAITAEKITATSEMVTKIIGADVALVNDMLVNGHLFANHATIMSAALQSLTVTEKANFVDAFAEQFMANSAVIGELLTSRLVVSAENFAPDPGLVPEAWSLIGADVVSSPSSATGNAIRLARRSGDSQVRGPMRPVRPGETIRFQGYYLRQGSGSDVGANVQLRMEWFNDPKGSRVSQTTFHTIASTMWSHTAEAEVVVPDGVTWGRFYIYQASTTGPPFAQFYGDMDVRPKLGGQLIVPGTIETEHLNVTEEMVTALLQAKKIETDHLAANAIDGMTINGALLTGATVRGSLIETTATSNRGIKLDSSQLRAWDSNGNPRFTLSASTGNMTATGTFRTDYTGNRVEIWDDGDGGRIRFIGGSATGSIKMRRSVGRLSMVYNTPSADDADLPFVGVEAARALISYRSNSIVVGGTSGSNQYMELNSTGSINIRGTLDLREANRIGFSYGNTSARLGFFGQRPEEGNSPRMEIRSTEGDLQLSTNGQLRAFTIYRNTTSSSANVYVDGAGRMWRSSSAAKYKADRRELEAPETLLDVPLVDWVDKSQLELSKKLDKQVRPFTESQQQDADAIDLRRIPGVVAEDVEAHGGEQFVIYGNDGEVEQVMYDRLAIAQIQVLKRQNQALEDRVTALENQLQEAH